MTAAKWHPRATRRHLLIGASTVALAFIFFFPISQVAPALVLAVVLIVLLGLTYRRKVSLHSRRGG